MKNISLVIFLVSQLVIAQNNPSELLKQEVLTAQSARITAMINADVYQLEKLLSEDLSYAHTTGWTETKSGFLETVASKKIDYVSFVPKDVHIRIFENTAVLTGLVDVNLGRTDFTIRFLEVQRKVNGNWQLEAWQSVINKVE